MKLKLALAACLAAFALPAAPATANEALPGTCYEITYPAGGTTSYPCECIVGVHGVSVSPPPPTITIKYCLANIFVGI